MVRRSPTFAKNENEFLWFCLTCRNTGIPPSIRLNITDEVQAMDADNLVTLRLLQFDQQQAESQAKQIAYEVAMIFLGKKETAT